MNDVAAAAGAPATSSAETAPAAPMTFDRMIAESGSPEGEAPVKKEAPTEKPADSKEDKSEKKEKADESDDSGAGDGGESGSGDDEAVSKTDSAKETDGQEVADLEAASKDVQGKHVAVKVAGKDLKLPEDAEFVFKKDGKEVKMSAKDIQNNVLTSDEISQKFSQLDREKKVFEKTSRDTMALKASHDQLEEQISVIKEAAESRNMFNIAQATLNLFSDGNKDIAKELFDGLKVLTSRMAELDDDQIKAQVVNSQEQFKSKKLEREHRKTVAELDSVKKRDWLGGQLKTRGIEWGEYAERYERLKAINDRRKNEGLSPHFDEKSTFEHIANEVVKFTLSTRVYNRTKNLISKVAPSIKEDPELIATICELTPVGSSEQDILEIIGGVLNISPKKSVATTKDSSKEVSASSGTLNQKSEPGKKEATPKRATGEKKPTEKNDDASDGPVTFDKLIKKYA